MTGFAYAPVGVMHVGVYDDWTKPRPAASVAAVEGDRIGQAAGTRRSISVGKEIVLAGLAGQSSVAFGHIRNRKHVTGSLTSFAPSVGHSARSAGYSLCSMGLSL
jgi:hypothetical protein